MTGTCAPRRSSASALSLSVLPRSSSREPGGRAAGRDGGGAYLVARPRGGEGVTLIETAPVAAPADELAVVVTQRHIDQGVRSHSRGCAVALAVEEHHPEQRVVVGINAFHGYAWVSVD